MDVKADHSRCTASEQFLSSPASVPQDTTNASDSSNGVSAEKECHSVDAHIGGLHDVSAKGTPATQVVAEVHGIHEQTHDTALHMQMQRLTLDGSGKSKRENAPKNNARDANNTISGVIARNKLYGRGQSTNSTPRVLKSIVKFNKRFAFRSRRSAAAQQTRVREHLLDALRP